MMNKIKIILAIIIIAGIITIGLVAIHPSEAKKPLSKMTVTRIIKMTSGSESTTLSKIDYEGRTYIVNNRGGIIEHKPK